MVSEKFHLCIFIWEEQDLTGQWAHANKSSLKIRLILVISQLTISLSHIFPLIFCKLQSTTFKTTEIDKTVLPDFAVKALIAGHCCWKLKKTRKDNKKAFGDETRGSLWKEAFSQYKLEKMRRSDPLETRHGTLCGATRKGESGQWGGKSSLKDLRFDLSYQRSVV